MVFHSQLLTGLEVICLIENRECFIMDLEAKNTYCGVPQGSCLGPLLFSIFINDLPYVVDKANIVVSADDSTMFSAAHTLTELQENLSDELLTIMKWVKLRSHFILGGLNYSLLKKISAMYLLWSYCIAKHFCCY